MTNLIERKDLYGWLKELARKYNVIAPVSSDGITLYKPVDESSIETVDLQYSNTAVSPKEYFFPLSGALFSIGKGPDHEITSKKPERETVIFGIRPCDAAGIALIDRVFLAEPVDTAYKDRRDSTILIGLACSAPSPECFCTSLGGGPANPMYVDILLSGTEKGFIAQTVTGKGKELLAGARTEDKDVSPPAPSAVEKLDMDGITDRMRDIFQSRYWDRVADRCLHCNICAYVCPCCYCFDIRDYDEKDRIDRVRSWESCQSAGFTKIAGGHDPRPTKGARLRQRWYHKLLYFPQLFGEIKCTGCGRCVRSCPVNIDIREIIRDIKKLNV